MKGNLKTFKKITLKKTWTPTLTWPNPTQSDHTNFADPYQNWHDLTNSILFSVHNPTYFYPPKENQF